MEKRGKIIGIIILIVFILLLINFLIKDTRLFSPPIPADCSDPTLTDLWDTVFVEDSSDIKIIPGDETLRGCSEFLIYKNNTNTLHFIYGSNFSFIGDYMIGILLAKKAIVNSNYLNIINNISRINETSIFLDTEIYDFLFNRSVDLVNGNDSSFEYFSIFNETLFNHTDNNFTEIYIPNKEPVFLLSGEEENNNISSVYFSSVYKSSNFSDLIVLSVNLSEIDYTCNPYWSSYITPCRPDDTYNKYHLDLYQCDDTIGMPPNETFECDYNNLGVIGDEEDIKKERLNPTILIENLRFNPITKYNGTKQVNILEGTLTRVKFDHDFTFPLNLKNIEIKKQDNSSKLGYLIINGLINEKEVTVDRLNSSNEVCVLDKHVSDINDFSSDCTRSDETLLDCSGNSSNQCHISSNRFIVKSLYNSAVIEIPQDENSIPQPLCLTNWTCSSWGTCSNNNQIRTCTDNNTCNSTLGKPSESQSCISCTTSWTCTSWSPSKCPQNEKQNRTCTDANSCGKTTGKPSESQTCDFEGLTTGKKFGLLGAILLLIGAIILALYLFSIRD